MSEMTLKKNVRPGRLARSQARAAWGLSAPALIIMFLFMILPFVMAVYYSFTNRQLIVSAKRPTAFVGIDNYIKVFTNKTALNAFWCTF